MIDFKEEFPILSKYTYLNTASAGLLPKSVMQWRHKHDEVFVAEASIFRDLHKPHMESIKETIANFVGAKKNETALVPNFSFGMNTFLDGLPTKSKILLVEMDYPSINWAVESRDFEIIYTKIDENFEQNIEAAIAKHKPTIFAFSIVQYLNGIIIDFNFLKELKLKYPDLMIVADGTQFLGTQKFNLSQSGIDVLGASCYKWLLAGYGNGIFIVKEEVQNRILPKTIGFNSAEAMFSKRDEVAFIKRFEPGHQDTLNYGSLQKAIQLIENLGISTIEEKISTLTNKAKELFIERNLLETAVLNRKNHSTIFNIKGDEVLFQKLKDNNIICSQRGKGIRFGFHFYNSEEDLNKLIAVLDE